MNYLRYLMLVLILVFSRSESLKSCFFKKIENRFKKLPQNISISGSDLAQNTDPEFKNEYSYADDLKIMEYINNEDHYSIQPLIEAQLLEYTLKENRLLWLTNILVTKSINQRINLIETYNKFLSPKKTFTIQTFHLNLEKMIAQKYPYMLILIRALTLNQDEFDLYALKHYLNNNQVSSITELLFDSSDEENTRLKYKFELNGKNLAKELNSKLNNKELADIFIKLINSSSKNRKTNTNSPNHEQIVDKICRLLKQKCQIGITNQSDKKKDYPKSKEDITDPYEYLNTILSSSENLSIKSISDLFIANNKDKIPIYLACQKTLNKQYCKAIEVIEKCARNKTEYLVNRFYKLINGDKEFGYKMVRLVLRTFNKNNREDLEGLNLAYQERFKIDLNAHLNILSRDFVKGKKQWWKFWEENQDLDMVIYLKGIQAILGNENWCTNECDVTADFKISKKSDEIDLDQKKEDQGLMGKMFKSKKKDLGDPSIRLKDKLEDIIENFS